MRITSPQNPRIKSAIRLRERRHRDAEGLTLVEGYDELSVAVAAGVAVVSLMVADGAATAGRGLIGELPPATEVLELSRDAFAKVAYRENPDGWLAVVRTPVRSLDDLGLGAEPLVLVVDGVEKPGNLGAMLRTADAAGVDAVILADAGTDPWNPNAIRASKGAVFSVPLVSCGAGNAIDWLAGRGVAVVAADPAATVPFTGSDLTGPTALTVGAEDVGLSEAWRSAASELVTIPMRGRVDSLNVATSAAVLLYEALRQRS